MKTTTLHLILILLLTSLAAVLFIIHTYKRTKRVQFIMTDLAARLNGNKADIYVFESIVLPTLFAMLNPFSSKEPTIENYFTPHFINHYLLDVVN